MQGYFIGQEKEHNQSLYIRRLFIIKKQTVKASIKLSALGVVKGFCNGSELDYDLLTPGWTDYNKRIPYYTFDITDKICLGNNVIAFTLGHGWAIGNVGWFGKKQYGNQPLMWCELELQYIDGTKDVIVSDDNFKLTFGQILENDLYDGEVWDARCDIGAFSEVTYDDSRWENATIHKGYTERLEAAVNPLTKKKETYIGTYLHDRNGYQVYDLKQNHAGVPEIDIKNATSGTKITFIYGEMLHEDGSIYVDNLRKAKATDVYICREGEQKFYPHMTFHGYRYIGIKVEGSCEFERIASRMIYTDISFHGEFTCSDATINQLYKNVIASQKSNFINVPTDCPQRDERLGWTGDVQIFCKSAMYNSDCREFFLKYLIDVIDAQLENGMVDWVAPDPYVDFDQMYGSPAWGDVITVLPYEYYCVYRDVSIIKLALPSAKKWVHYCISDSEEYVRPDRGYGDWLSMNEVTEKPLLGIFYIAYSALLTSKMCEIIGDNDADEYRKIYEDVRQTIRKKFMLEDKKLTSDTQTAYLLAYTFGIMTGEEIRPHLLRCIQRHNNHLSTGFVGVKYLLPVLCELQEYDLAYEIFTKKDFPSWCYPVTNGATTIWERWDNYVIGVGFSDPSTNSFNHYAYGSVCEWIFSMLLGIRYSQDGISICPIIDESGSIRWAKGSTVYRGSNISVEWKNIEEGWTEVTVQNPDDVPVDFSGYREVQQIAIDRWKIRR